MVRYQDPLYLHCLPWNVLLTWGYCFPTGFSGGGRFAHHVPYTTTGLGDKDFLLDVISGWFFFSSLKSSNFESYAIRPYHLLSLLTAVAYSLLGTPPRPRPPHSWEIWTPVWLTHAFQHYSSSFLAISRDTMSWLFGAQLPLLQWSHPLPHLSHSQGHACDLVITNNYKCCHNLQLQTSHLPSPPVSLLLIPDTQLQFFNLTKTHKPLTLPPTNSLSLTQHVTSLPYLIRLQSKVHHYNHCSYI